ncbi:MAG: hypothetical protein LBT46_09400, partial [Planctomycetaceae bacterium]|nr:hypothetical protein [Planctomycetaceae bacterium]
VCDTLKGNGIPLQPSKRKPCQNYKKTYEKITLKLVKPLNYLHIMMPMADLICMNCETETLHLMLVIDPIFSIRFI